MFDIKNTDGEYINTDAIQLVVNNIRQINSEMQNSKESLEQSLVNKMNSDWRSGAGEEARFFLGQINLMFNQSSNATDSFASYLQNCVINGYDAVEEYNENLGSQFL